MDLVSALGESTSCRQWSDSFSPTPALSRGTVLVWWMQVTAPPDSTLARWRNILSSGERTRIDQLHFAVDRVSAIAAGPAAPSV